LQAIVSGLAMLGERERCGALYPLCETRVEAGDVYGQPGIGSHNWRVVAGIAAHAAGLRDRACTHFEFAQRQAAELPDRILEPRLETGDGDLLNDHTQDVAAVNTRR
jgi:hypothetical protein